MACFDILKPCQTNKRALSPRGATGTEIPANVQRVIFGPVAPRGDVPDAGGCNHNHLYVVTMSAYQPALFTEHQT